MPLVPFELERYFAKYEFSTEHLLCSSDLESMTIQELLELDPTQYSNNLQKLTNTWLGYTEPQGSPKLKAEIKKLYRDIYEDQILVHAGAEEAIFNFMHALLSPDDHIIVHYPCYQSLFSVAESIGTEVTKWRSQEANDWDLDLDFLRDNIRANTKAIIINCPHNPTGYLMSKEKQLALVNIARDHNLIIFSDEVYRLLEYNPQDRLANACDIYENAVSLNVMSKSFGLAGLRIGWIATRNAPVFKAMAEFKDYTSICNSAPSEFLATFALQNQSKIIERNLTRVTNNLKLLDAFFDKYSSLLTWVRPQAGAIGFPRLLVDIKADEFCHNLITEKNVMLLPSTVYDYGNKNFRIGFGRKNMPEALLKLEEYMNNCI